MPSKCKFSRGIYGDSTQYVISEEGGGVIGKNDSIKNDKDIFVTRNSSFLNYLPIINYYI